MRSSDDNHGRSRQAGGGDWQDEEQGRGGSSRNWRESGQHEQFQGRTGQQGGYERGGGSYGTGAGGSNEGRRDTPSDDRATLGPYWSQDFGGGQRPDDRVRAHQSASDWQRGSIPNQFSRGDRGQNWQGQGRHRDFDYEQWRDEHMRSLDEDYEAFRRERYNKFADEFNTWRSNRASQQNQETGSSSGAKQAGKGAGTTASPGSGNTKQQG